MTLCLDKVSFERNRHFLLQDISFTLQSGDCLQIYGANGSGKSTLLRIIAGLIDVQMGMITWEGKCIYRERNTYQENIQYIGHQNAVKKNLTVKENLQLSAALQGEFSKAIETIIQKIGLSRYSETPVSYLSAGQMRRLSLARLLLKSSKIWILDEPLTALDSSAQSLLNDMLEEHLYNGGMAIVATHHDLKLKNSSQTMRLGE